MTEGSTRPMSPYAAVTERLIAQCQAAFAADEDLSQAAPSLNLVQTSLVVVESLEAEAFARRGQRAYQQANLDGLGDWTLATIAQVLFEQVRATLPEANLDVAHTPSALETRAWQILERILTSPTISPMLWYEGIAFDLGQEYRGRDNARALTWFKRGLAHNLRYNQGDNAEVFLRDIGETLLTAGDLPAGLEIFIGLLANNPASAWTYNHIALCFGDVGLQNYGLKAARRGLRLLKHMDDEVAPLRKQLREFMTQLRTESRPRQDHKLPPALRQKMDDALNLPFESGQMWPPAQLSRTLLPDLDQVPVKRPPTMPTMPSRPRS